MYLPKWLNGTITERLNMGCLNDLIWAINGEIIIYSANMHLVNLLPKRFRLSASTEVYNQ